MKRQVFNPYLPAWEYIPDGEPKKFGGRVYIFGSHDAANGKRFCPNDYVAWSAPEEDLSDWRYEGVIYRREQHPHEGKEAPDLWAPDVVQGPDGNYYLYYSVANSSCISVAKCGEPAGAYEYLGDVHEPDGHVTGTGEGEYFEFDPSVLVDRDGRVFLYSGSGQKYNARYGHPIVGCFVKELEQDMLTVKSASSIVLPADESIRKPSFFEGASIRHIGDLYYIVYPTTDMKGLGYATSRYPDRGFVYRGPIHSTSDIGYKGTGIFGARYPIGNNHGGLVEAGGKWYIFNHRMTNRTMFSRQGVAEEIHFAKDGSIEMVEATSCGLNGEPLRAEGTYPAYIACNLYGRKIGSFRDPILAPYIHQDEADFSPETGEDDYYAIGPKPYVKNIRGGSFVGFKYFAFHGSCGLSVTLRGNGRGILYIRTEEKGEPVGKIRIHGDDKVLWRKYSCELNPGAGEKALFFEFRGTGSLDMRSFTLRTDS